MATIPAASVNPHGTFTNRVTIVTWGIPTNVETPGGQSNLPTPGVDLNATVIRPPLSSYVQVTGGDTCEPAFCPGHADRTLQVTNSAGTVTFAVNGSNNGVNYVTLHDAFGNVLSAVAAGTLVQIMEDTAWVQVVPTGTGSGSAILVMRANF